MVVGRASARPWVRAFGASQGHLPFTVKMTLCLRRVGERTLPGVLSFGSIEGSAQVAKGPARISALRRRRGDARHAPRTEILNKHTQTL